MPVTRCSACETRRETSAVAVHEVVQAVVIVPVIPTGTHRNSRGATTVYLVHETMCFEFCFVLTGKLCVFVRLKFCCPAWQLGGPHAVGAVRHGLEAVKP